MIAFLSGALAVALVEVVPVTPVSAAEASGRRATPAAAAAPTPGTPAEAVPDAPAPRYRAVRDASVAVLRRSDAPASPRAAFEVRVGDDVRRLSVNAVPVLPGRTLQLGAPADATLRYAAGRVEPRPAEGGWTWTAPRRPGIHALELARGDQRVVVHALVMHPATDVRDETLNGYRIGRYVEKPLRGDPAYIPPRGFVEVRRADHDVLVSPRLTLGQFLCKQPGEPRYLAFSGSLVRKLEAVADRLQEEGLSPASLVVMSGFRTPAYNAAIGNTTVYSRHLWGDAADIYIDADGDGDMDDLNGDGRSDTRDARMLAGLVEDVERAGARPGGLSVYRRKAVHGPFVHVDTRGTPARW